VNQAGDNQETFGGSAADPWSGGSLMPMLIVGLVLTVLGMFAAVALS
jgi:hypothetical protein